MNMKLHMLTDMGTRGHGWTSTCTCGRGDGLEHSLSPCQYPCLYMRLCLCPYSCPFLCPCTFSCSGLFSCAACSFQQATFRTRTWTWARTDIDMGMDLNNFNRHFTKNMSVERVRFLTIKKQAFN
jgi:hypothetical protein